MTPPPPSPADVALRRKRAAARLVLWFERFWPAIWPALGVLGVYACAALLDIPGLLPPWPRVLLLATIARRWRPQVAPGDVLRPQFSITLRPREGVRATLRRRAPAR